MDLEDHVSWAGWAAMEHSVVCQVLVLVVLEVSMQDWVYSAPIVNMDTHTMDREVTTNKLLLKVRVIKNHNIIKDNNREKFT